MVKSRHCHGTGIDPVGISERRRFGVLGVRRARQKAVSLGFGLGTSGGASKIGRFWAQQMSQPRPLGMTVKSFLIRSLDTRVILSGCPGVRLPYLTGRFFGQTGSARWVSEFISFPMKRARPRAVHSVLGPCPIQWRINPLYSPHTSRSGAPHMPHTSHPYSPQISPVREAQRASGFITRVARGSDGLQGEKVRWSSSTVVTSRTIRGEVHARRLLLQ